MASFVLLLRGVNVGGNNVLPMQDLRDLLESLSCDSVATYIQSGNAVFRHAGDLAELSESIPDAIESKFAFRPRALLLSEDSFSSIAANNPYKDVKIDGKFVHISFLSKSAEQADLGRMAELATGGEEFSVTDDALYLYAPNGIGRSKLAAEIERCLGVPATSRNLRTVTKIAEMLESMS